MTKCIGSMQCPIPIRVQLAWRYVMLLYAVVRYASAEGRTAFYVRGSGKTSAAFSLPSAVSKSYSASTKRRTPVIVKLDAFREDEVSFSNSNFNNDILGDESVDNAHRQLQSYFSFPLDQWQLSAGASILASHNVIVCAPTGAGKTVVGEMALRIALQRDTMAIYTTPLKALSNQKFGEMRTVFGAERVGLATGDVSIRRGADVTIMTTEVYRNIAWRAKTGVSSLLNGEGMNDIQVDTNKLRGIGSLNYDDYDSLSSNSIVVLDEFHYMGQKGRGSTWEECVIFNPPHTQIVGLSATLPNANRLASWMESVTGRKSILIEANDKRPVPLRYYFATKKILSPLFRNEEAGPGAPLGLLGLRGDGVAFAPKKLKKKKKAGFGGNDSSLQGLSRNGMPRGLDLHPTLQSAAEKMSASIDRRIRRIVERESYDDYDGHGGGSTISAREQRKMKENMLKAELRKSVPSIATLLQRLQQRDLLPAIFFIFSRKGCDNAAEILRESLKTKAEKKSNSEKPVLENKSRKVEMLKGKGRGRGRRQSNNNDCCLNEDELAMVQDEEGRKFRADLLDQLLSDEYDVPPAGESAVGIEDNSFLSDKNIHYYTDIGLLSFAETRQVAARVLAFNTENPEIAFDDSTVEQLLCGIGSHHAGILPAHKAFVETLFRVELMKVVFATETLAAGINMPARTTVICSLAKRGDLGMELLETHNLLQMAGRAGRRGMDVEGACVISSTAFEGPDDAITILTNEIKPVVSQFSPSYALAVNLIDRGGGKLNVARNMVEKSFAVWESTQREEDLQAALQTLDTQDGDLLPEEQFLNALQFMLEKELLEARDGTSRTGTSQSKVSKLTALVDVLADGKKLKTVSKRYSGAAQILELEISTLKYLERELREMEEMTPDSELPPGFFDSDKNEFLSEIKTQRQRVMKGEREVNNNILSAMAKVTNNRMRDGTDGSESLKKALLTLRLHGEESAFPEGAPLEPGELNAYIKKSPKSKRRPLLDQNTFAPSEENESWDQMLALLKILEAYGCLTAGLGSDESGSNPESNKFNVTSGGEHVGRLGMDNSLWQLCALGAAWDATYESAELDRFQEEFEEALADFETNGHDSMDQEEDDSSGIPKPQKEAKVLAEYLCQLSPSEMAGYVSALVVDAPRRSASALESFHKLTYLQQRVVQGALLSLERLVEVQRKFGLDDVIGKCQLELSSCDVVTAWASGCSWNEALAISGAAPGDLVRTLSRTLDALRQLGKLPYLPARALDENIRSEASGVHPKIRSLCREAANQMDRYPVKDMLPFDDEELESEEEEEEMENDISEEEEVDA